MVNSKTLLFCLLAALAAQIGQVLSGPVPQDTTRETVVSFSLEIFFPLCCYFAPLCWLSTLPPPSPAFHLELSLTHAAFVTNI
jgi:hypothetical protein